jgi:hypothetical protein
MNFRNSDPSSESWRMGAPALILAMGGLAAAVVSHDKSDDASVCGPVGVANDSSSLGDFKVTIEPTIESVSYRVLDENKKALTTGSVYYEGNSAIVSYDVPKGSYIVDAQIGADGKEGCIIPVEVE